MNPRPRTVGVGLYQQGVSMQRPVRQEFQPGHTRQKPTLSLSTDGLASRGRVFAPKDKIGKPERRVDRRMRLA